LTCPETWLEFFSLILGHSLGDRDGQKANSRSIIAVVGTCWPAIFIGYQKYYGKKVVHLCAVNDPSGD
jgi:hypothetical protein